MRQAMILASLVRVIVLTFVLSALLMATPSTQVWCPAHDIQAAGTMHLGIDNYCTIAKIKYTLYAK